MQELIGSAGTPELEYELRRIENQSIKKQLNHNAEYMSRRDERLKKRDNTETIDRQFCQSPMNFFMSNLESTVEDVLQSRDSSSSSSGVGSVQ